MALRPSRSRNPPRGRSRCAADRCRARLNAAAMARRSAASSPARPARPTPLRSDQAGRARPAPTRQSHAGPADRAESRRRPRAAPRARCSSAARARCPASGSRRAPPPPRRRARHAAPRRGPCARGSAARAAHVVAALAQRRHGHPHHLEAEVEILAEAPLGHLGAQLPVGGGNQPDVGVEVTVPPTGSNSPVSRTRRSLACIDGGSSPISSRNKVPRSASSKRPSSRASRR